MKTFVFILFLIPSLGLTKKFSNEFIEFELPTGWSCFSNQSEWICSSSNKMRKKEATVVMTSKKRDGRDTLEKYKLHLKNRRTYKLPNKSTQVSDPKFVRDRKINNQKWVDSLHLASEIPGFYTRYVATTKKDIGVAVSFSVVSHKYNQYKDLLEKMLNSMKLFSKYRSGKNYRLNGNAQDAILGEFSEFPTVAQRSAPPKKSDHSFFILLLLLAGGGFGFYKYKNRKQESQDHDLDEVPENDDEDVA